MDGRLNVANALDGDSILVVAVDVLIFELANLVEENAEFVGYVRYVLVAGLAPKRKLLLKESPVRTARQGCR